MATGTITALPPEYIDGTKPIDFGNDPAAGSPTATLLRLLLLLAAEY